MNFSPNNTIMNSVQYQHPQCRPEVCINCPKKYYCQHYTQFLESNTYMTYNNTQFSNSMQQQPVISQPIKEDVVTIQTPNVDISPLLDIMEKMQLQVQNLSQEINIIKSNPTKNKQSNVIKDSVHPIMLPPPHVVENTTNELANAVQDTVASNEDIEEVISNDELVEAIEPNNNIVIYNPNGSSDTVLVQKKNIFGKAKWVEQKTKKE